MFKPLKDRVLLKIETKKNREVGGLIVMNQQGTTEQAFVLAVGSSVSEIRLAETVLIKTGAGIEVPEGRLIAENEVLAVYAE